MNTAQVTRLQPFVSILLIMGFLFVCAFIKMETRRLGYSFMKMAQKEKKMGNSSRQKSIELTQMIGLERVQTLATEELPLQKAKARQIIQMNGNGVAILRDERLGF